MIGWNATLDPAMYTVLANVEWEEASPRPDLRTALLILAVDPATETIDGRPLTAEEKTQLSDANPNDMAAANLLNDRLGWVVDILVGIDKL